MTHGPTWWHCSVQVLMQACLHFHFSSVLLSHNSVISAPNSLLNWNQQTDPDKSPTSSKHLVTAAGKHPVISHVTCDAEIQFGRASSWFVVIWQITNSVTCRAGNVIYNTGQSKCFISWMGCIYWTPGLCILSPSTYKPIRAFFCHRLTSVLCSRHARSLQSSSVGFLRSPACSSRPAAWNKQRCKAVCFETLLSLFWLLSAPLLLTPLDMYFPWKCFDDDTDCQSMGD